MIRILYIHQSAELYGSDKVLLELVGGLDRAKYEAIVLLPTDGPLVAALTAAGVECKIVPITRLSRATLSWRGLLGLPGNLIRSFREINRALNGRHVDVVHSNTLAVLSGGLWARWYRVPHVWHVHEIILHPNFVRKFYALLLWWLADRIICISDATKENLLKDKPALGTKIQVVWNGLERNAETDKNAVRKIRASVAARDDEVIVALVGRINRWKGQLLLVEAAGILWQQGICNIKYLIVGSAPEGQEHFWFALEEAISLSPARESFKQHTFTTDVWSVWDASDIAVIPSTEPEPFGMVALEAMMASKPVIAANHGGLSEIVLNEKTGLLIPPGDAHALALALLRLVKNENERIAFGEAGRQRVVDMFSLEVQIAKVCKVYESL